MSAEMFSKEFLNRMSEFLEENVGTKTMVDGKAYGNCVTRKEVCEALDIDPDFDGTVGAIVKKGVIPGYKIHLGPTGGIGRDDIKPARRSKSASKSTFPEGFLAELRETLDNLCFNSDRPVPRRVVAEEMGQPGSATENLISAALKLDEFQDRYGVRNGRYGGIVLEADLEEDEDRAGLDEPLDVSAPLDTSLEDEMSSDEDDFIPNSDIEVDEAVAESGV